MTDDGGFGSFKAQIMARWLAEEKEANTALAARVRALEEAQGELLGLLDAETGVTVRINGTGRTTAIDIKLGEWPFLAFDRHTGELVS